MSRLSGMRFSGTSPAGWATLTADTIATTTIAVPGAKVGDSIVGLVVADTAAANEYTVDAVIAAPGVVTIKVHPDGGGGGITSGTAITGKVVPAGAL